MSDIKIIEGLEPWQVMKRASEGASVAVRYKTVPRTRSWVRLMAENWDWVHFEYVIIDTSTSETDWDGVDWDFFNQYGGLPVIVFDGQFTITSLYNRAGDILDGETVEPRESPLYYWAGGGMPVPANVEVEIALRSGMKKTGAAGGYSWRNDTCPNVDDIIGVKITGKTL